MCNILSKQNISYLYWFSINRVNMAPLNEFSSVSSNLFSFLLCYGRCSTRFHSSFRKCLVLEICFQIYWLWPSLSIRYHLTFNSWTILTTGGKFGLKKKIKNKKKENSLTHTTSHPRPQTEKRKQQTNKIKFRLK